MKHGLLTSLGMPIMPLSNSAIVLDDKLLAMDNLESPTPVMSADELSEFKRRFPMKLPLNCMMIVIAGGIRFSINFDDYNVRAGTCVVIAADTIIERANYDVGTRVIVLMLSPHELLPSLTYNQHKMRILYARLIGQVTLMAQHIDMLVTIYRQLRTILTDSAFAKTREEMATHCVNLIASVLENGTNHQEESTSKPSRKDEIVMQFLQCVAANYRQHRDLGFYANRLCLSLKYMSHVVYNHTGRHTSQWIKDYVILDAKTMLLSGQYTIQQVADELNFANQSFFGKYFKEAVGVSPKKWIS